MQIGMIGRRDSETSEEISSQASQESEIPLFKKCGQCQGRWQRISEGNEEWSYEKDNRLMSSKNYMLWICRVCQGTVWEGENRGQDLKVCLGFRFEQEGNVPQHWIYRGGETHWDMSRPARGGYAELQGKRILPLSSSYWGRDTLPPQSKHRGRVPCGRNQKCPRLEFWRKPNFGQFPRRAGKLCPLRQVRGI